MINKTIEDFKELSLLGEGFMGRVVRVKDKIDDKIYALKIINKAQVMNINKIHHVFIEKHLLKQLNHSLIVKLIDTF